MVIQSLCQLKFRDEGAVSSILRMPAFSVEEPLMQEACRKSFKSQIL